MNERISNVDNDFDSGWTEATQFEMHPINRAPRLYWNGAWYWIVARGPNVSGVDGWHLALVSDDGHAEMVQPLHYRLALEWYRDESREFEFFDEDDEPMDPIVVNRYGEQIQN